MTQPTWDDDERLMDDLAQAVRDAAPLARTIAGDAEAALSWRTIDEELLLASLTFDSSLEPVREARAGPGEGRVLVFTSPPLSVEIEVLADQVVGQILPPGEGEIVVETPDGDVIAIRSVMNMVLAIDHRANDGAGGAQLLRDIKTWLEAVGSETPIY